MRAVFFRERQVQEEALGSAAVLEMKDIWSEGKEALGECHTFLSCLKDYHVEES